MSVNRRLPGILLFVSFLPGTLFLNSCKKDPTLPVLTTEEAREITITTATISGKVTSDGGAEVTARGICWGTSHEPALDDNFKASGTGAGEFTCSISGLSPNTEYYARAFAENSVGMAYGNEVTFVTGIASPTVSTVAVTGITNTGAVCGGIVTYNGGAPIIEKGICWSTSPDPDIEDTRATATSGNDSYTCAMTGLLQGTRYYTRAYVKNSAGTAYGEQVSFTTKIADIEGNLYGAVYIGNQVWTTENLKTTRLNDNTIIPDVPDDSTWVHLSTPALCWLRNDIQFKDVYGALYNWFTVETGKLCPAGWHVPSDAEYKTLEQTLGMNAAQIDLLEWRGTDQGTKMKSTTGWADGENGTNTSGFTALPGGYRWAKNGAFNGIGMLSYWWSSELNEEYGWYRRLDGTNAGVYRSGTSKTGGKYVRCVKD
jgi:uncharacterized protein (TIGR02145 family)